MASQRRLTRLVPAVLSAFVLAACASMSVNSYVERGVDFSRYRTFKFAPTESTSTGDPRLDNNPFFTQRIREAVGKELAARGLEQTRSARPDLLVHYHASISQEIDDNELDRKDCMVADCRPYVYDAGTLLIDFVDARTHNVVWRGWAEGSMDGVIDDQEWMNARIDDAVRRILKRLPRQA